MDAGHLFFGGPYETRLPPTPGGACPGATLGGRAPRIRVTLRGCGAELRQHEHDVEKSISHLRSELIGGQESVANRVTQVEATLVDKDDLQVADNS